MHFSRDIIKALVAWKNKPRSKPLILQGARQVGKTYVLKQFGRDYFENTAYFNFEKQEGLKQFFSTTKEPLETYSTRAGQWCSNSTGAHPDYFRRDTGM